MKYTLICFLLSQCMISLSLAEEVKLADASASASVVRSVDATGFTISVDFHPVTTLDDDSNREMTEVLVLFYAEEALSSFQKAQRAITPRMAKFAWEKLSEGKVRCRISVPVDAVIDVKENKVEAIEKIVGKRSRERISARDRILDFRSSCFRDLRIAESWFAKEVESAKSDGEKETLRRKMRIAFSSLRRKINDDDELFRAERAELLKKVDFVEGSLMTEAGGNDSEVEVKEREISGLIKEAVFREPFGKLLKSDLILLTHGGARFVEMDDGAVAVLAVGFAASDNDDREEIAELKASAELGKLRAGEETIVAHRIEKNYRRHLGGTGLKDEGETKRTSRTSMISRDFHKLGETVGTWKSKDGKRFFVAKGRIVRSGATENGR